MEERGLVRSGALFGPLVFILICLLFSSAATKVDAQQAQAENKNAGAEQEEDKDPNHFDPDDR